MTSPESVALSGRPIRFKKLIRPTSGHPDQMVK